MDNKEKIRQALLEASYDVMYHTKKLEEARQRHAYWQGAFDTLNCPKPKQDESE